MLKPEDARRELAKVRGEKHKKARLDRLRKLPKAAAAAGLGMFGVSPNGKAVGDWSQRRQLEEQSHGALAADPALRKKVLTASYPTFAKELELGWATMRHMPYTVGNDRRPFRAPRRPELLAAVGGEYLGTVNGALADVADDVLTPEWVAAWAVHLNYYVDRLAFLFAGLIDAGNDEVFEILKDSAANRHAIGGPGLHALRGLLCCGRPDAWEFVANLLLAAQRQEGLRQSILEAVDEARPEAFQQLLGIVLNQNLIRFAAAARAAGVWLGESLMVEDSKRLKATLSETHQLLTDETRRMRAVKKGDAETLYRALWALAHADVTAALAAAKPILKEKDVGRRLAAIKLLRESQLAEAADWLVPLLKDADPRILSATLQVFADSSDTRSEIAHAALPARLFEALEGAFPRLPDKPTPMKSPVANWPLPDLGKQTAADLLVACLQKRPAERLLSYLQYMSPRARVIALGHLCEPRTLTTRVRETLLACATETSTEVREAALRYLKKCKLAEDEARTLEGHLTRKNPDFRRGVFDLLLNRPDKAALGSVERLLTGDALQRAGGIELSRQMSDAGRQPDAVNRILTAFLESKGQRLPEADREAIGRILHPAAKPPTLDDGLGLFRPQDRSPIVPPRKQKVEVTSPAAVAFLNSLDDFIHEHRDKTFTHTWPHGGSEERVIGSIRWSHEFPDPDVTKTAAENDEKWPLRDIWHEWWRSRPRETRDADGRELLRAAMLQREFVREGEVDTEIESDESMDRQTRQSLDQLHPMPPVRLRYMPVIESLADWFLLLFRPPGALDFVLDVTEHCLASVPESLLARLPTSDKPEWTDLTDENGKLEWRDSDSYSLPQYGVFTRGFDLFDSIARLENPTPAQLHRNYRLRRWLEEPMPGVNRRRVSLDEFLVAYDAGAATIADFLDHLIGPRFPERYSDERFDALQSVTSDYWRKAHAVVDERPELRAAVNQVLSRIVEVELHRGEAPTAATAAAQQIQSFPGLGPLFPLIAALGKGGFAKSGYRTGGNRPEVLTHLIQILTPLESDTPAAFRKSLEPWLASGKISLERIVELGLANPRLIAHCAAVVGWPGYEEAAYWFMAHSNCSWSHTLRYSGSHDNSGEKAWRQIVQERSNLSAEQRDDGVIDVEWFHKAYAALHDDQRWDAIEKAARFLGYGHAEKKAARLADVLLGRTKKKELVDNIQKKYLKESVRLLGLLPLPTDAKQRDAELFDRYCVLKDYERYARGLSSLAKEPAMQAYRLGMENLAVTAGYSDPIRLEWAVTAKEVADLSRGPVMAKVKDVTIALRLGEFAEPEISHSRGKEELKSLPKELKSHKVVEEMLQRKKSLNRLAASTKRSLESAMCAGDVFAAADLQRLMSHAIVRPMLERLVLKTESGMGYPVANGQALQLPTGKTVAVDARATWSIAHPLDFVAAENWHEYQAECFQRERIQPLKQVFREVYTLTPAEKEDRNRSRRYSGQQVNENQAKALLSSRGWSTKEELCKLYRAQNLVVDLTLDVGYTTPGEAAAPAVGELQFRKRDQWRLLPLDEVPTVIFSEVMRDLDLVVSVAHVGGVDPEATQSTVEMRSSLLAETCTLLRLDNVKLDSKHALIRGNYGQYSVHLGSGVVHKQPGGSLCVVAVNAQHRGRLFLPFADDDPRTAEVVSKVLLLARDQEIQDPTILQQIAAV